ncbi:protein kinase [Hyphomicrobium sp.]|uniref:protein kinase domain-containing protein n=1 Tax=Hyphomicrobium sp. TaxID=82 RepID=UPI0025BB2AAB|nr:protein kinase [Hyphomicrobium sp.]MCC7251581.1 protein kinase [Hyphomicrobium sp.]
MEAQNDAVLSPGTRIDQYLITGLLGRGGFGITYLIKDEMLNKEFALKEFFPEDLVRREGGSLRFLSRANAEEDYRWGLKKFFDEARLLAQFNHPNIIGVRRVFEQNDTAYMVLDLVRGMTFEKWLRGLDSRPTQDELDLVAGPLLSALALVHENRTWHLDISPENIMIRAADGAPILLDFGASRFEIKQHSQLVSALVFKSGYSAPEQYTSNADRYGPWTDIYAFAATLYRAVTGERPDEATSRQLSDDLEPAAKAAAGHYRESFLAAIDEGLKLPPGERPRSVRDWRPMLLGGSAVVSAEPTATTAVRTQLATQRTGAGIPLVYTRLIRTSLSKLGQATRRSKALTAAVAAGLVALAGAVLYVSGGKNPFAECGGLFSAADCWGAVVDRGGNIFGRVEEPSREAAEAAAMKKCRERFDQGCTVIATISKQECWALAESPGDPTRWRASAGKTIELAQRDARWDCERVYGVCQMAMTFCADGKKAQ